MACVGYACYTNSLTASSTEALLCSPIPRFIQFNHDLQHQASIAINCPSSHIKRLLSILQTFKSMRDELPKVRQVRALA